MIIIGTLVISIFWSGHRHKRTLPVAMVNSSHRQGGGLELEVELELRLNLCHELTLKLGLELELGLEL